MIFKTWVYHSEHEPKIVDSDEVESLSAEGWHDSPAKCDGFLDKLEADGEDELQVQVIGEITNNMKDSVNLETNLDTLDRNEIIRFAEVRFGEDWSKKRGLDKMIALAKERLAISKANSEA